jgi:predicted nucleotide-binding protein
MAIPIREQSDEKLIDNMNQNDIYVARQMEMMRRLKNSIVTFDKNSTQQNYTIIKLTKRITYLTIFIVILTLVQIINLFI